MVGLHSPEGFSTSKGPSPRLTHVVEDTRCIVYFLLGSKVFGGTSVALARMLRPNHLHLRTARCDDIDGLGYATLVGKGETTPLGQSSLWLP